MYIAFLTSGVFYELMQYCVLEDSGELPPAACRKEKDWEMEGMWELRFVSLAEPGDMDMGDWSCSWHHTTYLP